MAIPVSWLKAAIITHNKPKPANTIIGQLRANLGGMQPGRSRSVIHASDITQPDFCPRAWAFSDLAGKKMSPQYVSTAQAVTWSMGRKTAQTLIEDWGGNKVIGNWRCLRCGAFKAFQRKPDAPGWLCKGVEGDYSHYWQYEEVVFSHTDSTASGSIDVIFDVGTPKYAVTELKIIRPEDWETLVAPRPEHRLRTSLYLKIIAESGSPYIEKLNLLEARVLYVSRGYGKMNAEWGEILPFKEFVVARDDDGIKPYLQRAKGLRIFREEKKMPSGICATATDKYAKKCEHCKACFSGDHPAQVDIDTL